MLRVQTQTQFDLYPWMWAELQDAPAAFTVQPEPAAARDIGAWRNDNTASIVLVIVISVGCVAALFIASRHAKARHGAEQVPATEGATIRSQVRSWRIDEVAP